MGFNGVELNAEGPIARKNGLQPITYLVAYRYSTLGVFQKLGINFGSVGLPKYQDASLRIDVPGKKLKGSTTLFGIGGRSTIYIPGSKDDGKSLYSTSNFDVDFGSRLAVLGLRRTLLHTHGYSSLTVGYNADASLQNLDSLLVPTRSSSAPYQRERFQEQRVQAHYFYNRRLGMQTVLRFGVQADALGYSLFHRVYRNSLNRWDTLNNASGATGLFRAYVQGKRMFGARFTLLPGLHVMHFALNGRTAVEPRLGASYQAGIRTVLSAGVGLHSRLQTLPSYFVETRLPTGQTAFTNKNLDFTRAFHAILGAQVRIGTLTRLKAEAYYQYLYQAPVSASQPWYSALNQGAIFGAPLLDSLTSQGKGHNVGLELTLERFMQKGYYYLITTSLYDSRVRAAEGVLRNSAFNGRYVFNALVGKEWQVSKRGTLTFDGRFSTTGGQRYTPVDVAATLRANDGQVHYAHALQNKRQVPPYARLDVRIGFRLNGHAITQEFVASIQNITGRKNVLSQTFDFATGQPAYSYQLGLFPVGLYKITF